MSVTPEPRLPPLPVEAWDEQARATLRGHVKLADRYLSGAEDAPKMPNVLGLFGHHLELGGAWLAYNGVLLDNPALEPRHRELIILRVSWRARSTYEWVQHVRLGRRVGITEEQIDAIALGADANIWNELDRLLLTATDQLIDRHRIDDPTWRGLTTFLDTRQLLETLFVAGSYLALAMVFNSVDLQPDSATDLRSTPPLPDLDD